MPRRFFYYIRTRYRAFYTYYGNMQMARWREKGHERPALVKAHQYKLQILDEDHSEQNIPPVRGLWWEGKSEGEGECLGGGGLRRGPTLGTGRGQRCGRELQLATCSLLGERGSAASLRTAAATIPPHQIHEQWSSSVTHQLFSRQDGALQDNQTQVSLPWEN